MQIDLPLELEEFISDKVHSGEYATASDLVADAIAVLRASEADDDAKLEALRREIAIGLEEADRGELEDFDIDEMKAEARRLGPLR